MMTTNGSQRGRKKKGNKESTQKSKKQCQRGMGVAQLEELRKNENLIDSNHFQFRPFNPYVTYPYAGFASHGSMGQMWYNNSRGFVGPEGPVGGFGIPAQCGETSTWITNLNMVSDQWGINNKKLLNGESTLGGNEMKGFGEVKSPINGSGFFGLNLEKNQFVGVKEEEIRVKSPSLASYVVGNNDKEGELVAVHRKADSSLLMEFDFFPGYKIGRDIKQENKTQAKDESLSLEFSLTTTTTSKSANASTSIDLSLKL